jgi:hypothetical protein
MKKNLLLLILFIVAVCVALAAGYAQGHRSARVWGLERLRFEVAGNTSLRVNALCLLRAGDVAGAITAIEQPLDQAVRTMAVQKTWEQLSPESQRALQMCKAYRDLWPSGEADIEMTLSRVPAAPAEEKFMRRLREAAEKAAADEAGAAAEAAE